ncbi:Do family serine endopeptidase [Cucumibacter marinus]|uniref:Do family serine endopeptidase n=1 Tax=Cucumibacter marinus TaxID=1121252 RepID=UPI000409B6D3|nr:Do family serine endopeptidase [Cucumibacter marinus]
MRALTKTPMRRAILAATAAVFLTGTAVTTGYLTSNTPAQAQISVETPAPASFADLVEAVSPAVVSIRVRSEIQSRRGGPRTQFRFDFPDLPEGHPLERFFRDFEDQFGGNNDRRPGPNRRQFAEAVGSGFVISKDGYVVTNNHVVDESDEVTVVMDNGDEHLAQVIGVDERTDLALLKIEAGEDLPYVEFADAEARVGDWVVAVGNPFGLGGTVTAGIVSARGRDINANAYDDFIQIDAAVNRGNSGGPAFNISGQVVGVNTAIFSPNGGNVGIAFAIPADVVKQVVFDLMDDGNVTRGFLGVTIQNVTSDIADSVGLDDARGALVTEPSTDSPAADAGVRSGDIILEVNGQAVESSRALSRMIAALDPGTPVDLTVWRDGGEQQIEVTLGTLSEQNVITDEQQPDQTPAEPEPAETSLGLTLVPNSDGPGLLIEDVDPESNAAEKGFAPADVILEANSRPVTSVGEFEDAVSAVRDAGRNTILIKTSRDGAVRFVGLPIS